MGYYCPPPTGLAKALRVSKPADFDGSASSYRHFKLARGDFVLVNPEANTDLSRTCNTLVHEQGIGFTLNLFPRKPTLRYSRCTRKVVTKAATQRRLLARSGHHISKTVNYQRESYDKLQRLRQGPVQPTNIQWNSFKSLATPISPNQRPKSPTTRQVSNPGVLKNTVTYRTFLPIPRLRQSRLPVRSELAHHP